MNYQPQNSHTSPLFRKAAVLKFKDKINLENCKGLLPLEGGQKEYPWHSFDF